MFAASAQALALPHLLYHHWDRVLQQLFLPIEAASDFFCRTNEYYNCNRIGLHILGQSSSLNQHPFRPAAMALNEEATLSNVDHTSKQGTLQEAVLEAQVLL